MQHIDDAKAKARTIRYAVIWTSVAASIVFALSLIFRVPYIYSIIGIAGLVFGGHFITLDDDYPGGWSNPDDSKSFWKQSLHVAFVKLVVVLALISILVAFPSIAAYGA